MDRYIQITRCFRDEDLRADRQPEFTQIDLEMSFVEQDDVIAVNEGFLQRVFKEVLDVDIQLPLPRMTWQDAMDKYGSDKPDVRFGFEIKDISDIAKDCSFKVFKDTVENGGTVRLINVNGYADKFPQFEYSEEENRLVAMHHPFTAPMDEDIPLLDTDPAKVRAKAYDIILNGCELGGGSIRIHDPELQTKMFEALGFTEEKAKEQFGHLITAFSYGAPPHGGLAYGLDRLCMLLAGLDSIRDVIAFPKVQNASDLMMNCPDIVDDKQLDDLSIAVTRVEEEPQA